MVGFWLGFTVRGFQVAVGCGPVVWTYAWRVSPYILMHFLHRGWSWGWGKSYRWWPCLFCRLNLAAWGLSIGTDDDLMRSWDILLGPLEISFIFNRPQWEP
jgi:hypothetical protein